MLHLAESCMVVVTAHENQISEIATATWNITMKTTTFWYVTLQSLAIFGSEDGDSMFHQKVSKFLPDYMA